MTKSAKRFFGDAKRIREALEVEHRVYTMVNNRTKELNAVSPTDA